MKHDVNQLPSLTIKSAKFQRVKDLNRHSLLLTGLARNTFHNYDYISIVASNFVVLYGEQDVESQQGDHEFPQYLVCLDLFQIAQLVACMLSIGLSLSNGTGHNL